MFYSLNIIFRITDLNISAFMIYNAGISINNQLILEQWNSFLKFVKPFNLILPITVDTNTAFLKTELKNQ